MCIWLERKTERVYSKMLTIVHSDCWNYKSIFFLFIFTFRLRWVFLTVRGLSLVVASGGAPLQLQWASPSPWWLLSLLSTSSRPSVVSCCCIFLSQNSAMYAYIHFICMNLVFLNNHLKQQKYSFVTKFYFSNVNAFHIILTFFNLNAHQYI